MYHTARMVGFAFAMTLASCRDTDSTLPPVIVTRGLNQVELLVDSELHAIRAPSDETRVTEVERGATIHVRGSFDLPTLRTDEVKFVMLITQNRPDGLQGFANEISTAERGEHGRFYVLQQIKAPSKSGTYMLQANVSGYELQECPITVK